MSTLNTALLLGHAMAAAYGETQVSLGRQALQREAIEKEDSWVGLTTRESATREAREYEAEMRAMGYNARKSNPKSKAVMLRKRGRV